MSAPNCAIPYLMKVDATTFEVLWQEHFLFTRPAYDGVACGVDELDNVVYISRIVENLGTYGQETATLGMDDIFIVQSQIANGHPNWIHQLGTQGNDRLAHGGSGLIVLERNNVNKGSVALLGDTTGDFQAINNKNTKLFVVIIDAAGNVPLTTETTGTENNGGSVPIIPANRLDDAATSTRRLLQEQIHSFKLPSIHRSEHHHNPSSQVNIKNQFALDGGEIQSGLFSCPWGGTLQIAPISIFWGFCFQMASLSSCSEEKL